MIYESISIVFFLPPEIDDGYLSIQAMTRQRSRVVYAECIGQWYIDYPLNRTSTQS